MFYGHVAQSSLLQGIYCCQSLINLSEITCKSKKIFVWKVKKKKKNIFKMWSLVVGFFFNNVCMYVRIYIPSFLNHCSISASMKSHCRAYLCYY